MSRIGPMTAPPLRLGMALAGIVLAALAADTPPARAQRAAQAQTPIAAAARALPTLLSTSERDLLARAYAASEAGRREEAQKLASQSSEGLARDLFFWLDLQEPRNNASFDDIVEFLVANPDWPAEDVLMRRAEEASIERLDDRTVLAWFGERMPATGDGALSLAAALLNSGQTERAREVVKDSWSRHGFGAQQEIQFLRRFGLFLGPADHWTRLDNLLWDDRREEARRMLGRVDNEHRALAEARIALAARSAGVDGRIRRVPAKYINDPGLMFERVRWHRRKGHDDVALEMLRKAPRDLGRAEAWWPEREFAARRLLAAGKPREAYPIVRDHRLLPGVSYVEAEFLAGWIALRRLNDGKAALQHFTRLHDSARLPVTRARGAYWAGRAAEALGETRPAMIWYRRAADYHITFYGQVAAARLGSGISGDAAVRQRPTEADREGFLNNKLTRAARIFHEIGAANRVKPFILRHVTLARSPKEHMMAAELALALGRPDLAVSASKRSTQIAGLMLQDLGWPVIPMAADGRPEPPLVLATIRQESAFETDAVSRAGARGLMQLLPRTARAVARDLGVSQYRDDRLLNDPAFNLQLGRAFLARQIDDFGGSYVLALAAYNAGPGRARAWIRDFGDPRDPAVDPLDWIESVPFEETRNYIQRVLENLQVYRQLLDNNVSGRTIAHDLR